MTKDETLQLALEALESVTKHFTRIPSTLRDSEVRGEAHKAITAIREALAQSQQERPQNCGTGYCSCIECVMEPQQEPVVPKCGAIIEVFGTDWRLEYMSLPVGKHKLYTQQYTYIAPPQRKPLTDEQIMEMYNEPRSDAEMIAFARAIEAAHGIGEQK